MAFDPERDLHRQRDMSRGTARSKPMCSSAETGGHVLDVPWAEGNQRCEDIDANEDSANDDGADAIAERRAERARRSEQMEADAEQGGEPWDDGPHQAPQPLGDAGEIDPQIERAESEGMVTEYAKISATDPGPEPLPVPEPEPDHGPGDDPEWDAEREPD